MSTDGIAVGSIPPDPKREPVGERPLAIEARNLKKSFRIPTHRVDSFKERLVRPFAASDYRQLQALNGISFEVHQGEFFGIVGRNGSGKSTLLKLLASIYRADEGTIKMAGRLAPFIELGVGFNVELSARENVVLNGVMMGLTPRETRHRLDAVIEFAELEDFVDLKLKNYSSGMLVRLAFSLMLEVDADVLLIDEVLAVGDAAFQQKCADAFHEMKASGKTIVLVTHEMATVEAYCHRAMLIDRGSIQSIGDPAKIGREYIRLNFEPGTVAAASAGEPENEHVRLVGVSVRDAAGAPLTTIEQEQAFVIEAELETLRETRELGVGFVLANADGLGIFQVGAYVDEEDRSRPISGGRRAKVAVRLENPLVAGRYFVHCGVTHQGSGAGIYAHDAADFVVFGGGNRRGLVSIPHRVETSVEEEGRR